MYRDSGWIKGHYIDNHQKHECHYCGKHFIIGEKLSENLPPGFPICPYCGQNDVERIAWTDNKQLEELASELGCIAICVDVELKDL